MMFLYRVTRDVNSQICHDFGLLNETLVPLILNRDYKHIEFFVVGDEMREHVAFLSTFAYQRQYTSLLSWKSGQLCPIV